MSARRFDGGGSVCRRYLRPLYRIRRNAIRDRPHGSRFRRRVAGSTQGEKARPTLRPRPGTGLCPAALCPKGRGQLCGNGNAQAVGTAWRRRRVVRLAGLRRSGIREDVAILGLRHEEDADDHGRDRDDDRVPEAEIDIAGLGHHAKAVAGSRPPNQPLPIW